MGDTKSGRKAKMRDLLPLDTKTLQLDPNNPAAFVGVLADAVAGEAEKAISWYLDKKDWQRRLSRTFRVVAIVLVMVAALLPILAEIFKPDGKPPIWLSPGWASVALVLAATLLVLDRFYGCSSSWMRFMATEMQIREALHVFRMDFQILRTDWPGGKPSEKQVREGLERCRGFLAQLDGLLRAELDAWVQEFRTSQLPKTCAPTRTRCVSQTLVFDTVAASKGVASSRLGTPCRIEVAESRDF